MRPLTFSHPKDLCNGTCPEGDPCCLLIYAPHTLHVCSNPDCACHSKKRYAAAKQVQAESA